MIWLNFCLQEYALPITYNSHLISKQLLRFGTIFYVLKKRNIEEACEKKNLKMADTMCLNSNNWTNLFLSSVWTFPFFLKIILKFAKNESTIT